MQCKYICWMLMVLVLNGHFYMDADGTVRVPGEGSEQDGLQLVDVGNPGTPELQVRNRLIQASRSGEVTGSLARMKRGVMFPSGVKLCSRETVKQALQNHLDFFHLRVCQEAVWEAFKIFWDRIPKRDEYQLWISRCQNGSVSVFDIGRSFSQSPEHLSLITSRVQMALAMGQQTTAVPTKVDILSTTDEVASVTTLPAEVNPADLTDTTTNTTLTPTEARMTTEEPGVSLTQVIVTTEQFTDAPLKFLVTTRQSMVTPKVATVTRVESSYTSAEAIVFTEQSTDFATQSTDFATQSTDHSKEARATTQKSIDIATKMIATAKASTNIPTDTVLVPTKPMSTKRLLTTGQSLYISTEAVEHPMAVPTGAMTTIKLFMDSATNVSTAEQSMNPPKETTVTTLPNVTQNIATLNTGESTTITLLMKEQSIDSEVEAIEAPSKQLTVTSTKATSPTARTTAHLITVSDIAAELEVTVEGSANPGSDLPTGDSQGVHANSMTKVTSQETEQIVSGTVLEVNHNTHEMLLGTTTVAFESIDVPVEVSVKSGLGEINIETEAGPVQVNNGGGGAAVNLLPSPTLRTTLEHRKDKQPEVETIESKQLDDSLGLSPDELPFPSSEDTHEGDEYASGSVIMEEMSRTVKDLSEVTRTVEDTHLVIVQFSNDDDVMGYNVSEVNNTFAGAEILLEAPTHGLSLEDNSNLAEVHASASADVSFDYTIKDNPKDVLKGDAKDKLGISFDEPPADITEGVSSVENTSEAQSEITVETAVYEMPTKVMGDNIAVENDKRSSNRKVEPFEVIPSTNGKDPTLTFTLHPSVIILDVGDFIPEVTPTTEDYTSGTHIMKIDIKEETPRENLLKSMVEGKLPEVVEDTTLTLPKVTGLEVPNITLDTKVPENTFSVLEPSSQAVGHDDLTLALHETIDRSTGALKQDNTPALSVEKSTVGINEMTTNMHQNITSSMVHIHTSTQFSNNLVNERNMIDNEIDEILAHPVRPITDQVVELSIKLGGETYDDALRNPLSFNYRHLSEQFIKKIEGAYKKLPGFQRVFIREFRPQKDIQGGLAVVVHYSIVLEGDVPGVNNKTITDITLRSNEVEKSYTELEGLPTVVYTVTDLRHYISQALREESLGNNGNTSLDVDPDSMQLENVRTLQLPKPTSRPLDSNNMLDNVLAAEQPPNIPQLEFSNNDFFINNEDFLFDTMHPDHPWIGTQTEVASENDIIILEDNPAVIHTKIPVDGTMEIEKISKTSETSRDPTFITEKSNAFWVSPDDIVFEEEGFLETTTSSKSVPVTVVEQAHSTPFRAKSTERGTSPLKPLGVEESVEEKHTGIGSGFSSPDQIPDTFPWTTDQQPSVNLDMVVLKSEDQKKHEKKNVEEEIKSEILVQQTTSVLDNVLMTQTHPQDTATEQAPLLFTMKSLMVELLMQTKEDPGISIEYSSELSTVPPVTEPPWQGHTIKSPTIEGSMVQNTIINTKNESSQGTTSPSPLTAILLREASPTGKLVDTLRQATESLSDVGIKINTGEKSSIVPATMGQPITDGLTHLPEIFEFEISNDRVKIIEDPTFDPTSQAPVLEFSDEGLAKYELTVMTAEPVAIITEAGNVEVSTQQSTEQPSFIRKTEHTLVKNASLVHSPVRPSHASDPSIPDEMMSQAYSHSTVDTDTQSDAFGPTKTSTSNAKLSTASHLFTTERDLTFTTVHQTLQTTFQPTDMIVDSGVFRDDHLPNKDLISTPSISDHISFHENASSTVESHIPYSPNITDLDVSIDIIQYDDNGSGFTHANDMSSVAMPVRPARALTVFFSLRVTNMIFSQDLFNKSSSEYKSLERQFLDLLVPYLQSNLSNFQHLEILNFRNGSIVVNSRMKFGKPVPHKVTTAVYLILENFCNTAYQTMSLAIDKDSLDVESGDRADPCKFQACNEFSKCTVSQRTGEAECVCDPGYFSMDDLPCRSICDIKEDFCLNDGKCDVIPGKGAICRCRVGENWWYRGEHCEEYVSEPLVVGIAVSSVAGFLLVAAGVMFFLTRTLREHYDKDDSEDPLRYEDLVLSLERGNGFNTAFQSDVSSHSHRYRQTYFSTGDETGTNIYANVQLMQEEIPDAVRIPELAAKDHRFADFSQQHGH